MQEHGNSILPRRLRVSVPVLTENRTLLFPQPVLSLSLTPTPALLHPTTVLIFKCFGSQAAMTGLLLGVAEPSVKMFTTFGVAMVPYLAFNAWFMIGPGKGVFTNWLALDLVGNIVYAVGSWYCVKLLREVEEENTKGA
jgi:hypothetical protein